MPTGHQSEGHSVCWEDFLLVLHLMMRNRLPIPFMSRNVYFILCCDQVGNRTMWIEACVFFSVFPGTHTHTWISPGVFVCIPVSLKLRAAERWGHAKPVTKLIRQNSCDPSDILSAPLQRSHYVDCPVVSVICLFSISIPIPALTGFKPAHIVFLTCLLSCVKIFKEDIKETDPQNELGVKWVHVCMSQVKRWPRDFLLNIVFISVFVLLCTFVPHVWFNCFGLVTCHLQLPSHFVNCSSKCRVAVSERREVQSRMQVSNFHCK